jgi:serine-type D-Ala-D-Ala carboxypeptidase/endopeptidase
VRTLGKLLALAAVTIAAPAAAQEAAGDWVGVLVVNESTSLPVVVHIKRDDAGVMTGTLDSPSQGAMGLPLAEIAAADGALAFKVPVVGGEYVGTWDAASKTWKGEWSQGGGRLPLELKTPPPPPPLPANWSPPSDESIAALIAERLAARAGQGLVIGVLEPGGRRVVAGGPAGAEAFDGDTLFEIGSISKVFTALILADMVSKGEVSLDDPAEKYLPAGARMPERGGRKITLADLSTHTSGLPRLPDNMPYGDLDDPYADYTEALMLEFLGRYELTRDIGSQHEYSNFGVGLLGYLLGRAAGSDYEALLRQRITAPLGMSDTAVTLSPDQQRRFAPGHDLFLRPAKAWRLPLQEGAGGIRSTGNDMLKLAVAVLDPGSPIAAAVKFALAERRGSGNPQVEQALGWQVVHPEPGRELLVHGGATGGYRAELLIEPAKGTAVVALANSAANPPPTDLAFHILVGAPVAPTPPVPPAPPPAATRSEITLPEAELERVVGRYEFDYGLQIGVTRNGTVLRAQRLGAATSPALQLRAAAPLEFFLRELDIQIRFTTDDAGKVTGAVMMQNGQEQTGRRLDP